MDGLRLIKGVPSLGIAVGRDAGIRHHCPPAKVRVLGPRVAAGNGESDAVETATTALAVPPTKQLYMFPLRLRRLWPNDGGGGDVAAVAEKGNEEVRAVEEEEEEEDEEEEEEEEEKEEAAATAEDEVEAAAAEWRRGNWVLKILRVGSIWIERGQEEGVVALPRDDKEMTVAAEGSDRCVGCGGGGIEEGCVVGEDEERVVFDRESFSRLLRKVSLPEAELYAKMSYLGNLAYIIPRIKPRSLLEYYGLQFVTSSLEIKGKSEEFKEEQSSAQNLELKEDITYKSEAKEVEKLRKIGNGISAAAVYRIAASAASYLQSQTKNILPFSSREMETTKDSGNEDRENEAMSPQEASFVATTNSVTAMVAGKEEMKQALAKDLNSAKSSPCEWFICDDDCSTRYFVIQGSETLASWQANLLFEPIQFEGLDVLVHRGIYEAAKGTYQQMLPEIRNHFKAHGDSATLRFTGHSLGGSLALLVNLMLLIRGEAKASSLLPVITLGAPSIMCGGDYLLRKLGLPTSHVQAITMHRDIVPRAFSCNYPDHVAKILKAVNGNFRNLPCLVNQKLLYAPMGKLLILQPEEKVSPHHPLLPPGSGFYLLDNSLVDSNNSTKLLQEAQSAFLNSPHPLEILSDPSAYGAEGTVYRDHDMKCYLRSVRNVIRQELKLIRKAKREQRRHMWWPLVGAQAVDAGVVTSQPAGSMSSARHHFSFAGILHGGRGTWKRFRRLVASEHVHMLAVLLFPTQLLLLATLSFVIS